MLFFLVGFLVGTLADYLIHRLIGHGPGSEQSSARLLNRHQLVHHNVFTDRRGMTAARGEARRGHILLQGRAWFVLILTAAALVGGAMSVGELIEMDSLVHFAWLGGGMVTALVAYNVLHWMHHIKLPRWLARMPGYRQARAWHHRHHREPDSRFAVLLPLWDFVLLTHQGLGEEVAQVEAAEEQAKGPDSGPRTGRKKRPTTSMKALLDETLAEADAEATEQEQTADRGKSRKRPTTRGGKRQKLDTKRGASTRKRPRTGKSSWLNVMSTKDDLQGVKVEAVREDDED